MTDSLLSDAEIALAAEAGYRKYWDTRTDKAWEAAGPITRAEWFEVARAMLEAALKDYRLQSAPKVYRTDEPPEDVRD